LKIELNQYNRIQKMI